MNNEELVKEIQNGINVTENMERLYENNLYIIRKLIKPYSYYESSEDLEQESYLGLCEAAKRYDFDRNIKFITYAQFWIVQAVRSYVSKNKFSVHVPNAVYNRVCRYQEYINTYIGNCGKEPHMKQIQADLGFTVKQIREIQMILLPMQSLDSYILTNESETQESTLADFVSGETNVEEEIIDRVYASQLCSDVERAVQEILSERQRTVIKELYFNNGTLKSAGKILGVSIQRVAQIQEDALKLLGSRGKKLLYQYSETNARAYRGTNKNFRKHNSSIVEYIAIKQYEIEDQLTKTKCC